jgi:hypothetical protein
LPITTVILLKKCKTENQTAAEEKAANEKRIQLQQDLRAARSQTTEPTEDPKARQDMDSLLENLRNGVTVGRKSRRNRNDGARKSVSSLGGAPADFAPLIPQSTGEAAAADKAKDMLAALKKEGFGVPSPSPSTSSDSFANAGAGAGPSKLSKPRRTRLRGTLLTAENDADTSSISAAPVLSGPGSALVTSTVTIPEDEEDEVDEPTVRLSSGSGLGSDAVGESGSEVRSPGANSISGVSDTDKSLPSRPAG